MQIVVVLGMHKSGTSLVSEILHHSGIEMVEENSERGYDDGFHHERTRTKTINKDLVGGHGLHSLGTLEPIRSGDADPALVQQAAVFVEDMSRRGADWGFKDPRTCLTYDFWRKVLPPHKLVCAFRDVAEVHHHYATRNKASGFRVLDTWFKYNKAMLDAFDSAPEGERIMIHYRSFMEGEDAFASLASLLDRPLADRRSADLRRSTSRPPLRFWLKVALHRMLTRRDVRGLNKRLRNIARDQVLHSTASTAEPATGGKSRSKMAEA